MQCEVEGKRLWIECKRPLSAGKVGKRIGDAYRQLHRDMKDAPPGTRGVIAVSLSKLVDSGGRRYRVPRRQLRQVQRRCREVPSFSERTSSRQERLASAM